MASKPKTEINPGDPGTERASRRAPSPGARKAAAGKAEPPREGDGLATLSADELNAMIARAAYLRAQQRGFEPGHEVEDWLAAEAEIRAGIGGSRDKR
jgi:Protein of unknown function (DUF2934)